MFTSRSIFAFILAAFAFALFASASPIEVESGLVARSPEALAAPALARDLVERCDNCCATAGCNEQAILDILIKLKASIDINVNLLDGIVDPGPIIVKIVADIKVAVDALVKVYVNVSVVGSLITEIVAIIVAIILELAKGCGKYGLLVLISISLKIDASLAGLINVLCGLIPTLQHLLSIALKINVNLLVTVKFVLTLVACGL